MALTGYKRSLTIIVSKTLAGEMAAGYPKTYRGLQAFSSYQEITTEQLSLMPVNDYQARLSAFKLYVQQQEQGLDIDATATNSPYYKPV